MPPKKKDGKAKKGGKKGKKEKNSDGGDGGVETINENSKQFYLYQIKDLEEKLVRLVSYINLFLPI